jgi:hypothetical protein
MTFFDSWYGGDHVSPYPRLICWNGATDVESGATKDLLYVDWPDYFWTSWFESDVDREHSETPD